MKIVLLFSSLLFLASCSTTNYYIVRHGEKVPSDGMMTSDVPLSEAGERRAIALDSALQGKSIQAIYATPYKRTQGTAQPFSKTTNIPINSYDPRDTAFVTKLKSLQRNVLVVGHSNTVDDIVNGLTGKSHLKDLPDTQYGDLFIVKRKGKKYSFETKRFGQ